MAHLAAYPWSSFRVDSGQKITTDPTDGILTRIGGGQTQTWLYTRAHVPAGIVEVEINVRDSNASGYFGVQLENEAGTAVTPLTLDGGTLVPVAIVRKLGVGIIRPTWNWPGGPAVVHATNGFTEGVATLRGPVVGTAPTGVVVPWERFTLDTTAINAPPAMAAYGAFTGPLAATGAPWVAGETAVKVLGVTADVGSTPALITIPIQADVCGVNAKLAGDTSPVTLVDADGATVLGDGSLTIPAGARHQIQWSGEGRVRLVLTKTTGVGVVSYAPLHVYRAPVPPPAPTITKIIPTSGPDTGGTVVDVIGTDLTGATAVDFDGTPGTGLTVDPFGGLATVTSPAHTAGPAPVTITTPAGTSAAKTFTFEAPIPPGLPTLTGIDPTEGPETGGTTALLTGTNLAGTIGVDFGGTAATIITTTDTALLVTTPAHAAGTVDVTATDGATTTDPLAFEYTEATGPEVDGPDVIANLVALLASELGVPVSSRRSPTATKDSDPSVVVRRTGGPSKGVASDNPTVTIEAWAPTTTESFQLLQSARLAVIEAAEQGRAGLRRYDEFAGPADLPDPSTTNPRHTLTASVVTRLE